MWTWPFFRPCSKVSEGISGAALYPSARGVAMSQYSPCGSSRGQSLGVGADLVSLPQFLPALPSGEVQSWGGGALDGAAGS